LPVLKILESFKIQLVIKFNIQLAVKLSFD